MREINKIAENLFEKVRDRFEDVSLGDDKARATQDPQQARFFNFDYVVDGHDHGNVTLSIIDETSLKVYFSKNITSDLDDTHRQEWYKFLRELREFAKRNLLSFEPRDITRSTLKHRDIQQVSKADNTYNADEVVKESRLYGTSRSSYENDGPVRIIIRHAGHIDPEKRGDRARHIRAMYLENSEGERLKLPHNSLRYARAIARHVSEGGAINDDFGQYITSIAEECNKLRPFKNSVRRRTFEDAETQAMVEAAFEYHGLLSNTLKRMGGKKGYAKCKENFNANESVLMDDFDLGEMRERFVKKIYKDNMDEALPIVQKAYMMKKENKFADMFEQWADEVSEGTWAVPDTDQEVDQLIDLLSDELPVGVDAENATSALYNLVGDDVLFDRLLDLAKQNPNADARPLITAWLENNKPDLYQQMLDELGDDSNYPPEEVDEAHGQAIPGGTENMLATTNEEYCDACDRAADKCVCEGHPDDEQIESIASAIVSRILNTIDQHTELLRKAGPDGVLNAAKDVASFHVPVEELGSSDISNMVREVYREVGVEYPEVNEGRMKEVSMDLDDLSDEEFKAKYGKTKEEMKQALAETQGADYVNKDEKLKRMGAKKLGVMDKIKNIPHGMKAGWKGDSEDELALYNKQKSELEEMRRLAGL